jgi:hypothetical protein
MTALEAPAATYGTSSSPSRKTKLFLLQTRSAGTAAAPQGGRLDGGEADHTGDGAARIDPRRSTSCSTRRSTRMRSSGGKKAERVARRGERRRGVRADTAAERGGAGEAVVLWETTPDDIHGMIAAQGSPPSTAA